MIPYDDLVIALQAWRARQGLPISQLSGQVSMTPPAPPAPPPRATPPTPPRSGGFAATPPPLAPAVDTHDETMDSMDAEEAGLLEEQYENSGDDFAMAFDSLQQSPEVENDAESTAIGVGPRDSFGGSTVPEPPKRKRNDSW